MNLDLSDLIISGHDDCFVWTGPLAGRGYGIKWPRRGKKRPVYIHRFVYELCYGPIPKGLVVHHRCENKRCANPLHLEVHTQRNNILDGQGVSAINARKTHCPKCGGDFNLQKSGKRYCRSCALKRMRAYYYERKSRD